MTTEYKLKSGQINYESQKNRGSFSCIVIRDGVFHNLSEEQRIDLIKILESQVPHSETDIDLEDMF